MRSVAGFTKMRGIFRTTKKYVYKNMVTPCIRKACVFKNKNTALKLKMIKTVMIRADISACQ
jgi:hypothetical protein